MEMDIFNMEKINVKEIRNDKEKNLPKNSNKIKKEKKIYYRTTMNSVRGIPPIPNWANQYSSIIIGNNLLYLSNNYIVSVDLVKKEFIQLIHSSNNVYFENKFVVICQLDSILKKDSYLFAAIDSYGNVCYFSNISMDKKSTNVAESLNMEKINNESNLEDQIYFKEEKFISKINRYINIKTIINMCYNPEGLNVNQEINILVIGDKNGNINFHKYYLNNVNEIDIDKNFLAAKKLIKGYSTTINFIKEKDILLISSTEGTIEIYKIQSEKQYGNNKKVEIKLDLIYFYENNLSFIFSLNYFLSEDNNKLFISILDKNGSFLINCCKIDKILETFYLTDKFVVINPLDTEKKHDIKMDEMIDEEEGLITHNSLEKNNCENMFPIIKDLNRFNNKSVKDEYLFFSHFNIKKPSLCNSEIFETYISSNKGKLYFYSIDYKKILAEEIVNKVIYMEIPENPHNKDIFFISLFKEEKLVLIGADGLISILNHKTKFFELDIKTIKYKPKGFINNKINGKNLFFFDQGNKLFKYNHSKINNGLQILIRNPLKIKLRENHWINGKNNYILDQNDFKNNIQIKMCIQSNFNENLFAIWEFNIMNKMSYLSIYDFESDTRIYRQDLLFNIKSMLFAFERIFDLNEFFNFRKDLKFYENFPIDNIQNNFLNNFKIIDQNIEDKFNDNEINFLNDSFPNLESFNFQEYLLNRKVQKVFKKKQKNSDKESYIENNEPNNISDYNLDLNEENVGKNNQSTQKTNKKKNLKYKKLNHIFDNINEKKFNYNEKYKKILEQMFCEKSNYELLHIIDENNNYIVLDYLKNIFNKKKILSFSCNKIPRSNIKTKLNNSKIEEGNMDDIINKISRNKVNNFLGENKENNFLLIPIKNKLLSLGNSSNIGQFFNEDIMIAIYENEEIKFGIINQFEDFIFLKVNISSNNFYYINPFKSDKVIINKSDVGKINQRKIFFSYVYLQNLNNNNVEDKNKLDTQINEEIIMVSLEDEKNLRIIKIDDELISILDKYSIKNDISQYKKRSNELSEYFENRISDNSLNNNQDFEQIYIKNFINIPSINLKIIQKIDNENKNIGKIDCIISMIAALMDNSIKIFEYNLSQHSLYLKYSINAHIAKIQDISFISIDKISSLSYDQSLKIWDINKCKPINLPISFTFDSKISNKPKNQKKNIDVKNDEIVPNLSYNQTGNKITPLFNRVMNDAIFSQSFLTSNEFLENFKTFIQKLKKKKLDMKSNCSDIDINPSQNLENTTEEFFVNLSSEKFKIKNKSYLDYFIFIFSDSKAINKLSIKYIINYETQKLVNDNTRLSLKNIQSFFGIFFYYVIFFDFVDVKVDYLDFLIKIKDKINDENISHQVNYEKSKIQQGNTIFESNNKIQNEYYLHKVNSIIDCLQQNEIKNINNLKKINKILFNECFERESFFDFILNKDFINAQKIIEDNDLFFENVILSKLIDSADGDVIEEYKNFRKKIEKFRYFIYSKQIYQAQKCQSVINILNDYFLIN